MSSPAKIGKKPLPGVLRGINHLVFREDKVLTHTDNSGGMTPRSVFRHAIHKDLKDDLITRVKTLREVLENTLDNRRNNIIDAGKTWFGKNVEPETLKLWLSTMEGHLPGLPFAIDNITDGHRGEAPGRFYKFPGKADPNNTIEQGGKPVSRISPPGVTINARNMPLNRNGIGNSNSLYEQMLWTYAHEASHAILSTRDRVYLNPKALKPESKSKEKINLREKYITENADHHAGFIMNAWRQLNSPVKVTPSFPPIAQSQRPSLTQGAGADLSSSNLTPLGNTVHRPAFNLLPPIASAQKPGASAFGKYFKNP